MLLERMLASSSYDCQESYCGWKMLLIPC